MRDEIANLVWGVERVVPLATGTAGAAEAADETLAHRRGSCRRQTAPPSPPAAPIAYRVMSTVPENWIPFVRDARAR